VFEAGASIAGWAALLESGRAELFGPAGEELRGRRDRHDRIRCEEVQILSGAPNQLRPDQRGAAGHDVALRRIQPKEGMRAYASKNR